MIGLARLAMLKGYIDVSRGNGNLLSETTNRAMTNSDVIFLLASGIIILCLFITMCIWWDKQEEKE